MDITFRTGDYFAIGIFLLIVGAGIGAIHRNLKDRKGIGGGNTSAS